MMFSMRKDIERFVREVSRRFDPDKVVLFGSHAAGTASPGSDVDILVLMDFKGRAARKAFEIRMAISRPFPLDLIVRRPGDVRRRVEQGDPFLKEIMATGRVLYERNKQGMV
jgi:predicted nucleotidyltransferase